MEAQSPIPDSFGLLLRQELMRRCHANPRYSLRRFARNLDYDPSTLAKILSGKRQAGAKVVSKLGKKLGLQETWVQHYSRTGSSEVSRFEQYSLDSFALIADWYHHAILELLALPKFQSSPRWIGRKLGISERLAEQALNRLARLGLIEKNSAGRWIDRSWGRTTTVGQVPTEAHRHWQRQILQKAMEALDGIPVADRDQSSVTFVARKQDLELAREKIKKFRRSLSRTLAQSPRPDSVYQLSISLFPLTVDSRKSP